MSLLSEIPPFSMLDAVRGGEKSQERVLSLASSFIPDMMWTPDQRLPFPEGFSHATGRETLDRA